MSEEGEMENIRDIFHNKVNDGSKYILEMFHAHCLLQTLSKDQRLELESLRRTGLLGLKSQQISTVLTRAEPQ